MDLPPYIPGSRDLRTYAVRGAILHVSRGDGALSVGFNGRGRDGDYVPDGAPEPAIINEMLAGVGGLTQVSPCDCGLPTEEALALVEGRMSDASGGAITVSRAGDGSMEVARALLDLPAGAAARSWSLRGAWSLTVDVPLEGDATATPWAWGRDPVPWLGETLAAMGVPAVVRGKSGNGALLAVPRERVRELLERALAEPLLGPGEFRVTDRPARP